MKSFKTKSFTSNEGLLTKNQFWGHNPYKVGNGFNMIKICNETTCMNS